jgi:pilus assembly protein CpaD
MLKRTILLASALAPALLLGACGGTTNRGLESVHQPVVSRTDYVFDVNTSGNGLAPGEEQRLAGWMASLRLSYGDQVAIDDPHPYGSGVHDTVAAQVARYGLLLSNDTPVTDAPLPPGTVRIVITRMKATVPGCPDFSRENKPEFNSNSSSNLGCAINSNLAAMVANPADLVRGQPGAGDNDNISSGKAIDTYRKAPTTGNGGLKSESTGAK